MSIPMIVLLSVLTFFVLLVAFVLFSPLWVRVKYQEILTVAVGLSFIKFNVYPEKKKEHKKKGAKKKNIKNKPSSDKPKQKEAQQKTADKTTNTQTGEKESVSETLSLVLDILKSVTQMFGKRVKINIRKLICVVSRPDAADTAICFGICSGVVSTILALCSDFGKFKADNKNVGATMDFLGEKSKLAVDITISASTVAVIISLIKGFVTNFIKKQV